MYTEGGSQKPILVVLVVVISFLNTQCSATKHCLHIRAQIPHVSTVSDFYTFTLISN